MRKFAVIALISLTIAEGCDEITPGAKGHDCPRLETCTDYSSKYHENCKTLLSGKLVSGLAYCDELNRDTFGGCSMCACEAGCESDGGSGTPRDWRPGKDNPFGAGTPTRYNGKYALSAQQKSAVVAQHNFVRAYHGACPLQWSDEITQNIWDTADTHISWPSLCKADHTAPVTRSGKAGFSYLGENLVVTESYYYPSNFPVDIVTMGWYLEEYDYDYNNSDQVSPRSTGSFTQVVWKETTHVGCVLFQCGQYLPLQILFACQYGPAGNHKFQYGTNVGERNSTASGCTACGMTKTPTDVPSAAPASQHPSPPPTQYPTSHPTAWYACNRCSATCCHACSTDPTDCLNNGCTYGPATGSWCVPTSPSAHRWTPSPTYHPCTVCSATCCHACPPHDNVGSNCYKNGCILDTTTLHGMAICVPPTQHPTHMPSSSPVPPATSSPVSSATNAPASSTTSSPASSGTTSPASGATSPPTKAPLPAGSPTESPATSAPTSPPLGQGETHSPTMVREAAATTPKEDSDDDSSWVPYVLSGVGGICLLCGLIAFFVIRRRESMTLANVFNKEGCNTDTMEVPILYESEPSDPLPPTII